MRRDQGAVKLGFMTPFFNNVVSLMCGILVFATVFSVQRQEGKTIQEIVNTLQYNGPGNTGLTFIWLVTGSTPHIHQFVNFHHPSLSLPHTQDATFVWQYWRGEVPGCYFLSLSHFCRN